LKLSAANRVLNHGGWAQSSPIGRGFLFLDASNLIRDDSEVCPECGERYFHATTLDRIDEMIGADHPVKETMTVVILTA
jgi:hypothetical protein